MQSASGLNPSLKRDFWTSPALKRAFDIVASGLGLVLLSPLFLWLAWRVRRESPGPVFFRGRRSGKEGREFYILKFRTMYENPASYAGSSVTGSGDPRITPLGKWLRDSKLNELPQLWNVLKGEMSLVGPRPEDPAIVATWPEGARREILALRPGITSPASILYHNEEKRLSQAHLMEEYFTKILPDKLRLDRLYARHHSLLTDLDVLFWTLVVLLPRALQPARSEGALFGGPFNRLARRYLSWTMIDFLTAFVLSSLTALLWRLSQPFDLGWPRVVALALFLALEVGLCNTLLGLEKVEWSRAAPEDTLSLLGSGLLVILFNSLIGFLLPGLKLPSGYLLLSTLISVIGLILVRYRSRLLTGFTSRWLNASGYGVRERALIVGAGAGGEFITWLLSHPNFRSRCSALGYIDDDPRKQGMRYDGLPVLGSLADLPDLLREHDIGLVFLAVQCLATPEQERILQVCQQQQVRVVTLSNILEDLQNRLFPLPSTIKSL